MERFGVHDLFIAFTFDQLATSMYTVLSCNSHARTEATDGMLSSVIKLAPLACLFQTVTADVYGMYDTAGQSGRFPDYVYFPNKPAQCTRQAETAWVESARSFLYDMEWESSRLAACSASETPFNTTIKKFDTALLGDGFQIANNRLFYQVSMKGMVCNVMTLFGLYAVTKRKLNGSNRLFYVMNFFNSGHLRPSALKHRFALAFRVQDMQEFSSTDWHSSRLSPNLTSDGCSANCSCNWFWYAANSSRTSLSMFSNITHTDVLAVKNAVSSFDSSIDNQSAVLEDLSVSNLAIFGLHANLRI